QAIDGNIAFNTGGFQPLTLDTTGGIIDAGTGTVTFGTAFLNTGLPDFANPGALLTVSGLNNVNAGTIVFNGILPPPPPPPPPPGPVLPPGGSGGTGGTGLDGQLANNQGLLDSQLGTRLPTDTTPFQQGHVSSTNYQQLYAKQIGKGKGRGLIPGATTYASDFNVEEATRLTNLGIKLGPNTGGNYIDLHAGNVVFAPSKNIVVGTHEGTVHIPAGAVALVMESGADVAVYDLHQRGTKGIQIVAGKKLISLDPGREVVLSRQKSSDFRDVMHDCKSIGFRSPKHEQINGDIRAFAMDFSIPSAIAKTVPLRNMMKSDDSMDRKAIRRIMMNAVLLEESTSHRGPFSTEDSSG
ncbi:MAG TPA: hypothetical protein V6D17_11840, partial [Candidatus Obscuribacterales bacterium]